MAGMAGFEPTDAGVKVPCLTAWLHPNEIFGYILLYHILRPLSIGKKKMTTFLPPLSVREIFDLGDPPTSCLRRGIEKRKEK